MRARTADRHRLRLDKLHQTVIARFRCTRHLPRPGHLRSVGGADYAGKLSPIQTPDYYDDFGMLVTFMIVFVGYCYGRFELMFGQVKQGIRCIFLLHDGSRDVQNKRASSTCGGLNLLHASAYVSSRPRTRREPLHRLRRAARAAPRHQGARAEELAPRSFGRNKRNSNRGSFGRGSSAAGHRPGNVAEPSRPTCRWPTRSPPTRCGPRGMVWSLEVIGYRYKCGDFSAPILLGDEADQRAERRAARAQLLEYQVLPYIYTHLVSLSCMIYLVVSAFIKGAQCESSELSTSIVLPTFAMLLQTITVIGLWIAILATRSPAKEAFAICHLLNFTSANSLSVVSVDSAPAVGGTSEEAKRFTSSTGRGSSDATRRAAGSRARSCPSRTTTTRRASPTARDPDAAAAAAADRAAAAAELVVAQEHIAEELEPRRGVRNMTNDTPPHKATAEASTDSTRSMALLPATSCQA